MSKNGDSDDDDNSAGAVAVSSFLTDLAPLIVPPVSGVPSLSRPRDCVVDDALGEDDTRHRPDV